MLCWIDDLILKRIRNGESLKSHELPIGEHGTFHREDREVYFMSNYDFGMGDRIYNVQIREIIENIVND